MTLCRRLRLFCSLQASPRMHLGQRELSVALAYSEVHGDGKEPSRVGFSLSGATVPSRRPASVSCLHTEEGQSLWVPPGPAARVSKLSECLQQVQHCSKSASGRLERDAQGQIYHSFLHSFPGLTCAWQGQAALHLEGASCALTPPFLLFPLHLALKN